MTDKDILVGTLQIATVEMVESDMEMLVEALKCLMQAPTRVRSLYAYQNLLTEIETALKTIQASK